MKTMMVKQQGITFLGLVFVLGFIAIVVLFVLRAFPLYNEKFQVVSAMNTVANRPDAAKLDTRGVHKAFITAMAVTNINRFTDHNIKDFLKVEKPAKRGGDKIMQLTYEGRNKLFADLYLLMAVDEKIPLRGAGGGD